MPNTAEIRTPSYTPGTSDAIEWVAQQLRVDAAELVERESFNLSGVNCGGGQPAAHLALLLGRARDAVPKLRSLSLHGTHLASEESLALLAAGVAASSLTHLDLSNNAISDLAAEAIGRALLETPQLRTLLLFNNKLSTTGVKAIAGGHACGAPCGSYCPAALHPPSATHALARHSCCHPPRSHTQRLCPVHRRARLQGT